MKAVAAAFVLIVCAIAGCEEVDGNASPVVPTTEEDLPERADLVMACGLGLMEAERRGLVASDAQMPPPWRLSATKTAAGERVRCHAGDRQGELIVVVDMLCTDVNEAACHPLIEVERP